MVKNGAATGFCSSLFSGGIMAIFAPKLITPKIKLGYASFLGLYASSFLLSDYLIKNTEIHDCEVLPTGVDDTCNQVE